MFRSVWKELASVALVLVALGVVVFWPAFDPNQGDVAGRYDVHRQFGPWNYFFDHSLAAGDFPEWNPLVFSGAPHAANPQSWALYPPNLLRALLHRAPTPHGTLYGLGVLMGLHLLVWGLGIYRLSRAHGLSREAALLASLVASFSALMVRRIAEYHFIFTLAYLPWLLLCVHGLARSQRAGFSWRRGAGFTLLLALLFSQAVLGGFLQIVPHLALSLLAYALTELALATDLEGPRRSFGLRVFGLLGLAGLFTLGLSAVLLVPSTELLSLSPRAAGSGVDVGGHKPEAWNLVYAARSLLVYSGRIFEPETLRGAGIIALALACAGAGKRTLRQAAPFLAMLYAMLDLMLGPPWLLSSTLSLLSPVQLVSGTRAFDLAMLPIAILAGLGLDRLGSTRFAAAITALVVTLFGVLVLSTQLAAGDVWVKPDASVWYVPLAFALALGLFVLWPAGARWRKPVLLFLFVCEIVSWNRYYAPALLVKPGFDEAWAARDGFSGQDPFWPHNRRETTDRENFTLFSLRGISNGYDPLYLLRYREAVSGKKKLRYRRSIKETEAVQDTPRGHLFLKRAFWLVPSVVKGPMPGREALFAPTEVAFVTTPVPQGFPVLSRADAVGRAQSRQSREVPLSPPRLTRSGITVQAAPLSPVHHGLSATFASDRPAELEVSVEFRDAEGTRSIPGYRQTVRLRAGEPTELNVPMPDFQQPRIDLGLKVHDGSAPRVETLTLHADMADEDAQIRVVERLPDSIEVELKELKAARLLAFIDVDYPGWRASVDGKPVSYARVNDAFKGVWLTPGSHRVRFEFASPALRTGAWISLATLLVCLGLWLSLWRGRGPSATPAKPA